MLWSSRDGQTALDYGGETLPDERRPAFVASDDAVILNETRIGMGMDGARRPLVASSQDWSLDERTDPDAEPSEEQLHGRDRPEATGRRARHVRRARGEPRDLPVLMNDHDPNEDVLSIDPASVTGLDPGFGTVSITDDGQRLTVRVAAGASGHGGFTYAVTDGTREGGLCPSRRRWSSPSPGSTTGPAMVRRRRCLVDGPSPRSRAAAPSPSRCCPGWVDPEGDPLLLLSSRTRGVGSVAATPRGDVVYQCFHEISPLAFNFARLL